MTEHTPSQRDRLGELAESFVARFRAGERPGIEGYACKYPELADELRQLLPALVMLEQHGSLDGSDGVVSRASVLRPVPREIGEFTIVREIGRGGMGVVYEAVQQSLGRHVALKVLSSGSLMNPVHLERFRLEARSAGRLHHSHIVPVFGVGESDGLHYYAMQFISGQSLDQVIDALSKLRRGVDKGRTADQANGELTDPIVEELLSGQPANVPEGGRSSATFSGAAKLASLATHGEFSTGSSGRLFYESVARVGLQVAEALAYAHGEGLLHRDIKPSNLILDAKGSIWVTDFGLVKADDTQSLTDTGDFVGTLRYMAPERLEGWSDRRSDVYGLGASLYELLTLCTFFENANRGQLIDHIRHRHPEAPTKVDPAVPRDLETIVLKALAKEPGSRYHTADEMAEDLRRFLADRPILGRRSTTYERLVRWCGRNPAVASLVGVVGGLLVATVAILMVSNAQIRHESEQKALALRDRDEALSTTRKEVVRSAHVARFLKEMLNAAGPSVARGRDATVLREILDQTAERIDRELGDEPEVQGDLLVTLAETYVDVGDKRRAVTMFERAVAAYRRQNDADRSRLAIALSGLGRTQSFLGDVETGHANAQSGLQLARASNDAKTLARCLFGMAKSMNNWGISKREGIPYVREAVALHRQLRNDPAALADCQMFLAGALDETDEAESLAREALQSNRAVFQPDHPKIALSLLMLGQTLLRREKYEEAEDVLRETCALWKKVYDAGEPYQPIVARAAAIALAARGKLDESAALLRPTTDDKVNLNVYLGVLALHGDWPAIIERLDLSNKDHVLDNGQQFDLIIALANAERHDESRRYCHEFLDRTGSDHAALAALITSADGPDFERSCQIANRVTTPGSLGTWPTSHIARALAEYRREQFAAAQDWAMPVATNAGATGFARAEAYFIQALASARLQQFEDARAALDRGQQLVNLPRTLNNQVWARWGDWAAAKLLREEVVDLILTAD